MAAEVARFFRDLRGALRLNPAQAAQALSTRVDIIADNVPNGIAAKDHAAGLASSLMNLAEYLEGSWKT